MTRSWPPFLSPGWLCAMALGAAIDVTVFAIFDWPLAYVAGAFIVLVLAAFYGNGRDR